VGPFLDNHYNARLEKGEETNQGANYSKGGNTQKETNFQDATTTMGEKGRLGFAIKSVEKRKGEKGRWEGLKP